MSCYVCHMIGFQCGVCQSGLRSFASVNAEDQCAGSLENRASHGSDASVEVRPCAPIVEINYSFTWKVNDWPSLMWEMLDKGGSAQS